MLIIWRLLIFWLPFLPCVFWQRKLKAVAKRCRILMSLEIVFLGACKVNLGSF